MTDLTAVNASAVTEAATLADDDFVLSAVGGVTRKTGLNAVAAWLQIDSGSAADALASAASAAASAAAAGAASGRLDVGSFAQLSSKFNYTGTGGRELAAEDDIILWRELGAAYRVLASGASGAQFDYTGTGGVKLVALPSSDGYDIRAFGCLGDGSTDDTAAMQIPFSIGNCQVKIPATAAYYKLTDDITVADGTRGTGDGWSSEVRQTVAGKNVFVMGHNCSLNGVHVKMPAGNNLDLTKQNAVYINGKTNVTVENCILELADIAVSGVQLRGAAANISIINNTIFGGGWSTSGAGPQASASDILIYSAVASGRIMLKGNYCLSNNSQGIFADALGYNSEMIISENICITLDPTTCTSGGAWSEIASGGVRRHGIVVGYNDTSVNGPRTIVSNNICRNTIWTGIYFQGVSEGRTCIGNICTNNGYDTANTLSGGIYIIQNGYEVIADNIILDFKNTNANTGGITINRATTNSKPTVVRGNLVRDSLSHGITMATSSSQVQVADNILIDNAGNDIYANPSAAVAAAGGHHIVNNRAVRASGSVVPCIRIGVQASTLVTVVHGNDITGGDNTTVSNDNCGIQMLGAAGIYSIKDNTVSGFYHGIICTAYQTTNRNAQIEDNEFRDCSVGISIGATTNNVTVPVVNNRFVGMLVGEVGAALGGGVAARVCTREGTRLVVHTFSAAPTVGDWAVGDRAPNNVPAVGSPKGWTCTAAGTPGTWTSEGNL